MKRFIFSKIGIGILGGLVGLSGIAAYVWNQEHRPALFEMYIFGLKSSTSAFIRTPDDTRILINGGSNSEVIRHISKILPFYSRRIDMVITTDTDKKNITGLIGVVGRYSVDQVIVPHITLEELNLSVSTSSDRTYDTFLSAVRKAKIPMRELIAGEEVWFASQRKNSEYLVSDNVSMRILFPVAPETFSYSKASAPELLFNINHGSINILWAGAASKKIQKYVAPYSSAAASIDSSTSSAPADILIVSHSALPANLDRTFLETYQPESLIYSQSLSGSSGANPFSYDSRFNIQENTIRISSDGISVRVERMK
jgi:hypothetical protein